MQAYREEGIGAVEWVATIDGATDPVCAAADGEQRPIGERFSSGVSQPPVHPNCRCSLAPVVTPEQVAGAEEAAEAEWKPSMSKADADKYIKAADSKVTKTLYHGTNKAAAIQKSGFEPGHIGEWGSMFAEGTYFTAERKVAATYGNKVLRTKVVMEKPYVWKLPNKRAYYDEIKAEFGVRDSEEITALLRKRGFDGLIVQDVPVNRQGFAGNFDEYIIFDRKQAVVLK